MRKLILIAVLAVPFMAGAWFFYWSIQAPSTNTVKIGRQPQEDVLGTNTTVKMWDTSYFSSAYPSNFRIRNTNEVQHGNTLGQYMLSSSSIDKTDQLAITVGLMPDGQLNELSDIKVRMLQPDTYVQVQKAYILSGGMVFSRVDGTETAVFMQEGARYASIVVTGSATRQQILEQSLRTVVSSWSWE